jgi:hypothetical protein
MDSLAAQKFHGVAPRAEATLRASLLPDTGTGVDQSQYAPLRIYAVQTVAGWVRVAAVNCAVNMVGGSLRLRCPTLSGVSDSRKLYLQKTANISKHTYATPRMADVWFFPVCRKLRFRSALF